MIMKGNIVIFVLLLYSIHCPVCHSSSLNPISALVTSAKSLMSQVSGNILQSISNDVKKLSNLQTQISIDVNFTTQFSQSKMGQILNETLIMMNNMKNAAIRGGANIADCISQSEPNITQLPVKFLENEMNCVVKEAQTAYDLVNGTIELAARIIDDIQEYPNLLVSCTKDPTNATKCLNDFMQKLVKESVDLSVQMGMKVATAIVYVSSFQTRVQNCATQQIIRMGFDAGTIVLKFSDCLVKKTVYDYSP